MNDLCTRSSHEFDHLRVAIGCVSVGPYALGVAISLIPHRVDGAVEVATWRDSKPLALPLQATPFASAIVMMSL